MPPEQCPACGRFLAAAFVVEAVDEPQPCPGCGEPLGVEDGAPVVAEGIAPAEEPHPLDDWDHDHATPVPDQPGGHAVGLAVPPAWRPAAAAVAGGVLGAVVAGRSRRRAGALVGAALAGVAAIAFDAATD